MLRQANYPPAYPTFISLLLSQGYVKSDQRENPKEARPWPYKVSRRYSAEDTVVLEPPAIHSMEYTATGHLLPSLSLTA